MAYDPLDDIDSLLRDPVAYSSRRKKKKQEKSGNLPALSPEERQSLASQLGSGVISGISAVGNLLDLPGSSVRDLFAGQNPLDQYLSPFTANNRTTGRELLRQYGAVGRDDNYGNWWGGLGAEVALDPLTYLTLGAGALTKAGRVAKNAGILAKATRAADKAGKGARALRVGSTLDDIIGLAGPGAREAAEATAKGMGVDLTELGGHGIGGLFGIGLPFARQPAMVFGGAKRAGIGSAKPWGITKEAFEANAKYRGAVKGVQKDYPTFVSDSREYAEGFGPVSRVMLKGDERIADMTAGATRREDRLRELGWQDSDLNSVKSLSGRAAAHAERDVWKKLGYSAVKFFDEDMAGNQFITHELLNPEAYKSFPTHRAAVEAAIAEGNAVSPKVLADYPDLHVAPKQTTRINPLAQKIAGGLDTVGDAVRYGKYSPVRHLAPLFDHRISGTTKQQQQLSLDAYYAAQEAEAAARTTVGKYIREFHEAVDPATGAKLFDEATQEGRDNWRQIGRALEGIAENGNYQNGRLPAADLLPAHLKPFASQVEEMRQRMPKMLQEEWADGLPTADLGAHRANQDIDELFADYFPREKQSVKGVRNFIDEILGHGKKMLDTAHPFQKARTVRNVPGGRETIERIARDPRFQDWTNPDPKTLERLRMEMSRDYGLYSMDIGDQQALLRSMNKQAVGDGNYWKNPLESLMNREAHSVRARSTSRLIQDTLSQFASVLDDGSGMVPVSKVVGNAGLTDVALNNIRKAKGVAADVELYVPGQVASDAARLMKVITTPEEVTGVLRFADGLTNAFKFGVTSPFPGFHTRNLNSGQVMNWIFGMFNPQSVKQAGEMMQGKVPKGLGKSFGVSDDAAYNMLREEAFAHQVFDPSHGPVDAGMASHLAEQMPGMTPITLKGAAKDYVKTGGRSLGSYVEGFNRLSPYIELRRQGVQPAEAAMRVRAAQIDYRALSDFERKVMKRAIPFYSFTRRVTPVIVKELMERPGGRLAQTVRATNRTRGEGEFLPEQIAQTVAMPIGGDLPFMGKPEPGFNRYLTGLGLAHEDPLNIVRPGANAYDTVKGTGQELLGRMNPLVKGPLELAFGIQAFSGRDMRDLDPGLGRIIANVSGSKEPANTPELVEQLLANSPASRALTTVRTLTDTRKGRRAPAALNLLTGVRVSDVDMAKAEKTALRERLEDKLRGRAGVRTFESYYSPDPETLSPNDALLMSLYRSQLNEAQAAKRHPKKKKAKKNRTVEDLIGDLLP